MRLTDTFRTTAFRTTAVASSLLAVLAVALLSFGYAQMAAFEYEANGNFIEHEIAAIVRDVREDVASDLNARYAAELQRRTVAGLFSRQGQHLTGSILELPAGLPADGTVREVTARVGVGSGEATQRVLAAASVTGDGRVLVVGRGLVEWYEFRRKLLWGIGLSIVPSLMCGLAVGILASRRTLRRLHQVGGTIERIINGDLHQRLETDNSNDAFDQLTTSVNRMLDEIQRLLEEVQSAGDAMAHDLRTPLARVRMRLEGARARATTVPQLQGAVDAALADLEGTFDIITALLRIAQIDGSIRQAGFAAVPLDGLLREAVELYEPLAEARDITLRLDCATQLTTTADRELLFEALANLLDNAIKFAPAGSVVDLIGERTERGARLVVRDRGPGIAAEERRSMIRRFHRAASARSVPGHGLGLSLVSAIVRLHCFELVMYDAQPGLRAELCCWAPA